MYTGRYSTFAAPAAALLIAEGLLVLGRLARPTTRDAPSPRPPIATVVFVAMCAPVYVLQRGPYAKNDSDWAEVSAAMAANAAPGDAVVFDQSTKPSQRPRLAMRTYSAGFRGLRTRRCAPSTPATSGGRTARTRSPRPPQRGRFDGVERVWLIEIDEDGRAGQLRPGRPARRSASTRPDAPSRPTGACIIELTR